MTSQSEKTKKESLSSLSFEQALEALQKIVSQLEQGQAPLDEAVTLFEQGALLQKHCEEKLKQAETKLKKIIPQADGSISTEEM